MIDGNGIDRLIGALAGTLLAIIFILPKSKSDLIRRCVASTVAGLIFPVVVIERFGWTNDAEHIIAAGTLAAFAAWWLMGAAVKAIGYLPSKAKD